MAQQIWNDNEPRVGVEPRTSGKSSSISVHWTRRPRQVDFIDHIDNDKLNNNISNLRWATNQENQRNAKLRKDNTSGTKGVTFDKSKNRWKAQIQIDGIINHLGYYLSLEEAKQARITKANIAFGAFTNACEKI